MDGDRPMVVGRDLLESELQDLIRKVWNEACKYGNALYYARVDKEVFLRGYDYDIHELLTSYLDSPSGDVSAQDEVFEEGEMRDSVRPESRLIPRDHNAFVADEWGPIKKITDEFAREMDLRFAREGKRIAIGHSELTKMPDGSIHASIKFFPQNPR